VEAAEDEVRAKEFPGLLPAIVGLIPDNPVRHLGQALTVHDQGMGLPALLVFSLFFSVAILLGPAEVMDVVLRFIRGLFAVSMNIVNLAIRLTPFCIVFVAFNFAARLGFDLMSSLSMYVATFFLGWLAAYAVLFPLLLSLFGGRSALDFYRRIKEPFWFAFVTSSSSATYPLALETAKEKLGIPESTARFVLTLGAVANQTGSTLFAVVSSLFLADVFGVRLSGAQQLEILALGVAVAFATPGVPGGDLPLLATFCLLFGIPTRAVALVIGVNRLLDVGVTTINVGGDLVVASILGRGERGKGEGAIP
jgi:DAACS family dicarboxylate/amino acid:cation (Na+ or H+) symporter